MTLHSAPRGRGRRGLGTVVMGWLYQHRPAWLGRLAMWLFDNTSAFPKASPYLLGIALGSRPRRMR